MAATQRFPPNAYHTRIPTLPYPSSLTLPPVNALVSNIPPLHAFRYDHVNRPLLASCENVSNPKDPLPTPRNPVSRGPGVAPLSRLLHSEPYVSPHSEPTTGSAARLRASPRSIPGSGPVFADHSPRFVGSPARYYRSPDPLHRQTPQDYGGKSLDGSRPVSHRGSPIRHLRTGPTAIESKTDESVPDGPSRYRLTIRQQPVAARACGQGERDRRVVDPPPILQLSLADYDPGSASDVDNLRHSFNIVHCTLHSVASQSPYGGGGHEATVVPDPHGPQNYRRELAGSGVANSFVGIDPAAPASASANARLGCFFIFHDLSCRHVGLYRLRFALMTIRNAFSVGSTFSVMARAESDVFEVYSAKDFPGMQASTSLTRELKRQGATVQVKKGADGKASQLGQKRGSTPSEGSGAEDNLGATSRSSRKRLKT